MAIKQLSTAEIRNLIKVHNINIFVINLFLYFSTCNTNGNQTINNRGNTEID